MPFCETCDTPDAFGPEQIWVRCMGAQLGPFVKNLKMQMWKTARCKTGRAQGGDLLTLFDLIANPHQPFLKMHVIGLRAVAFAIDAVIHLDPVPIARFPMRCDHAPACRRKDGRTKGRMHVDAKVVRDFAATGIKLGAPELLCDRIGVFRHRHTQRRGIRPAVANRPTRFPFWRKTGGK